MILHCREGHGSAVSNIGESAGNDLDRDIGSETTVRVGRPWLLV